MAARDLLRPKELSIETTAPDACQTFTYWLWTARDYIDYFEEGRAADDPAINKARIIVSCLSPSVYPTVEEEETFDGIIAALNVAYVKKANNVYARHLLVSRRQQPGESVTEYAQALKELAKECSFTAVTASEYRAELTKDAFINGLAPPLIRQGMFEKDELSLVQDVELADSLGRAQKQAATMSRETVMVTSFNPQLSPPRSQCCSVTHDKDRTKKCFFCGGRLHAIRCACPAFNAKCYICDKYGHFARVCRANARNYKTDDLRPISAAGTLAAISVSEAVLPGANSRCSDESRYVVSRSRPSELGLCGSHSQSK